MLPAIFLCLVLLLKVVLFGIFFFSSLLLPIKACKWLSSARRDRLAEGSFAVETCGCASLSESRGFPIPPFLRQDTHFSPNATCQLTPQRVYCWMYACRRHISNPGLRRRQLSSRRRHRASRGHGTADASCGGELFDLKLAHTPTGTQVYSGRLGFSGPPLAEF